MTYIPKYFLENISAKFNEKFFYRNYYKSFNIILQVLQKNVIN